MGSDAIKEWGVGQKEKDNGAILFVFTEDRQMRIEVGYGLEATLTDAQSKRITSTIIKPEFKNGDYAAGVEKGVDAIIATVRREGNVGTGKTVAELKGTPTSGLVTPGWIMGPLFLFLVLGTVTNLVFGVMSGLRRNRTTPDAPRSPVRRVLPWLPNGAAALLLILLGFFSFAAAATFAIGALVFLGFSFVAGYVAGLILGNPSLQRMRTSGYGSSSDSFSSSSDSSSDSSSSSSSSSFSGGGGSGGGGGASDRW